MIEILVSACLLGHNTKYNGKNNYNEKIKLLDGIAKLIPICPEMDGGLPCPRTPAERQGNAVVNKEGKDVTECYNLGAMKALGIAKERNIKYALLKEKSPSCGVHQIYDGTFTSTKIDGLGVAAELLQKKGIKLFNELEIDDLIAVLSKNSFKRG